MTLETKQSAEAKQNFCPSFMFCFMYTIEALLDFVKLCALLLFASHPVPKPIGKRQPQNLNRDDEIFKLARTSLGGRASRLYLCRLVVLIHMQSLEIKAPKLSHWATLNNARVA